ncbi:hypothetical protein SRABI76_03268 [Microbacterium oxydans]|uniref:Uncharacterized protein n=1 Tax=Microbacterium oxydans TaxID=82380 RepID=A0A0F0LJI2_9MICO|nr:hypothetical protein [Microbacterium oxydans]KJL32839.1 hypothetical protein RS83_00211 [Microbacterium oxydans]CAH0252081.1 hypothetical protein SRABI76_03268 [Microbacterium oxydans]
MRTESRPARPIALRVAAWTLALLLSVILFAVAWAWCWLGFEEEFSEEGKAQAAGTTMAGWGLQFGLIPVLVLHALVLIGLFLAIRGGRRGVGLSLLIALGILVAASLPGFVVVQVLSGGSMFEPPVYVP